MSGRGALSLLSFGNEAVFTHVVPSRLTLVFLVSSKSHIGLAEQKQVCSIHFNLNGSQATTSMNLRSTSINTPYLHGAVATAVVYWYSDVVPPTHSSHDTPAFFTL